MTQSERERRIKAAARAFYAPVNPTTWVAPTVLTRNIAAALDAADEAVPMVPLADSPSGFSAGYLRQRERAERAEAAARDFAKELTRLLNRDRPGYLRTADVLARHPSFSGEEGTGS